MNRITLVLLVVFCSAALMYAQSSSAAKQMDGTICYAACVTQQSNLATCDPTCTDNTGPAVFVSDSGSVMQVANQDMCKSRVGKHVSMTARSVKPPSEHEREQWVEILSWNSPGG